MKELNRSLANKWLGYTGMAAAFLAVAKDAEAQVIYTDVNPDSVLVDAEFGIDFDNDSVVDLTLDQEHFAVSSTVVHFVSVALPTGNQLIGSGFSGYVYPAALASGAAIDPGNVNFHSYNAGVLGEGYPNGNYGNWPGKTAFLGCRFVAADGQSHYGWVKLAVSGNAGICTVMGFGYESQPNVAIAAGDMGPASIAENGSSDLKVAIAPNPVLDNVSISIDASGEGPSTVTLLNSLGEVLQKDTPILGGHCMINMSNFEPGVYFLRIHKGDRVITRTLTKL